ncbi:efflux RND transporter periplasmic adaptor subunit [Pricia sp. S334]|uniref:Efflux RND transporter periplasmic adaptor subunit n=1 Tax=Pricia mediterranea TaxID=3076079 RepID=A0ABU3L7Y8_9FLAO|nr:efflux RND transporter periplasmic adaptor subunit [Pricia sp. S334]MDT7829851.1 efflux RND transporter periplasmic adaptor subunit [Pricia sp. S334]
MEKKKIVLICVGILLLAGLITSFIFLTEPTAKSEGASKQTAMLVNVVSAEKGDFNPVITATGTVRPVDDVVLSPLVGGQILRRDPSFTPGGRVSKGEVLLKIDPADYGNTLELRRSELQQSQTDLNMEMGRQQVAEQDLALIGGDSLSSEEKELVLRKPQLDAVKANLKAAKASVDQAQLDLRRTTVRAPFDAQVLSRNVTVGSQVSPGDNLGRLVGTDAYWVEMTVPVSQLRWLDFPLEQDQTGSSVELRSRTAWKPGETRTGHLYRQVGALDDQTRLSRVLVRVEDPLAQNPGNEGQPPLIIGSFVEARIQAEPVVNVVRLNRDYVRSNETVWVMQDKKLQVRKVEILLYDAEHAYILSGLEDGDQVVTTNLSTVAEGVSLRTEGMTGRQREQTDTTKTQQ